MVYLSDLVYSLQFVTRAGSARTRTGLNMAEYALGRSFDFFHDGDLAVVDKRLDHIARLAIGLAAQLNRDGDLSFCTYLCHCLCWTSFHSAQSTPASFVMAKE